MPERVEESMKLHGWCGNGRRLCSPTNPPQRGQAWGWEAGLVRPQHCSRSKKWFRFCLRFVLCVQVQVLSSSVPTEPPSQLPRASKPAHGHSRASPCWDLDFPQRRPEEQVWTQPLAPVKRPAISAGSHLWVCGACIVGIRSLHPWAMGPMSAKGGPSHQGRSWGWRHLRICLLWPSYFFPGVHPSRLGHPSTISGHTWAWPISPGLAPCEHIFVVV